MGLFLCDGNIEPRQLIEEHLLLGGHVGGGLNTVADGQHPLVGLTDHGGAVP